VRRSAVAAVAAALAFGFLHVPMNLGMAGGDWSIAFANALVLQTPIGLAFCIAYQRHRAPLALGAVHAILMA
jgi:membrane protease YdiL (CAAX protease family)